MAKTIDYSKWDNIEISDDEDDTHPNIDTPSLFRWRHQARVDRMAEAKSEKEEFESSHTRHQRRMNEMRQKVKQSEMQEPTKEFENLKIELSELEKQEKQFMEKEEELKKKEKLTPLNIDTLCKDGKSKTIINKDSPKPKELTEDERAEKQIKFQEDNEAMIKKFGMFQRYEDSQKLLEEHRYLVCEETANFLVIWCINLEVEEKHNLMAHVAHQTIVMQFILELARSLKVDSRACVGAFFSRIVLAEKQYMDAFTDELESFKERIRGRAKVRIENAMKEAEEEERQQRLGPGGLDPVEVFESLPKVLQECFESREIGQLQDAMSTMPKEEAEYHLKRCVDSGLWVANAKEAEEQAAAAKA